MLVATLISAQPLPAFAGDEFRDANTTTFDQNHVTLDNQQAGQTIFTIDTNRTTIGWQDLQQPGNNRLEFNFTNGGRNAAVLNYSESINPIRISGQVVSNGTVGFANQYGVFIDGKAVIDVGSLVAIGGNVSREAFLAGAPLEIPLQGRVENHGLIRADGNVALLATSVLNAGEILAGHGNALLIGGQKIELDRFDDLISGFLGPKNFQIDLLGGDVVNTGLVRSADAAFFGGHVLNLGEIQLDDGSLLMVGADAVYVTRFDDPVLIRLPRGAVGAGTGDVGATGTAGSSSEAPRYAIENHGQIDAGRGHVRLAAADPLGFGIRQGTGTAEREARIAAKRIELEGGENGRVHLAGVLDASDDGKKGRGGAIDVTGDLIALAGAEVDASGTRAGGQIRIGGEQQGSGDLQRARSVVVDEASGIHADATSRGDGGRVIVFSEDLTSVAGDISARGGAKGGDGGFVETSGLRYFAIDDTPDVSARRGDAGHWLIDPYDITITNTPVDCNDANVACLDPAIVAILDPEFDSAGFDGIIRTSDPTPNDGITPTNYVSADLIERALGIGTNVTLSTQAFGKDTGTGTGNITIDDVISIDSARVLEGTVARLTLLAAGHIFVNENIEVLPTGSGRSNLALSVELHANDASQKATNRDFGLDLVSGDVVVDADIVTGGGSFVATGISILQSIGKTITTLGGDVRLTSGTVAPDRAPFTEKRSSNDPDITNGTLAPRIELQGDVDTRTRDGREAGGRVSMVASSVNVGASSSGKDPVSVVTGLLRIVGDVVTGGGAIALSGGVVPGQASSVFAGDVDVQGNLDSDGGDVTIRAHRVNPANDGKDFDVTLVAPSSDPTCATDSSCSGGGEIRVAGSIRTGVKQEVGITKQRTKAGSLAIGNDSAKSIVLDGVFDTTQTKSDENGVMQLIARDSSGAFTANGVTTYGDATLSIGTNAATTIRTAGLAARSRDVAVGDGAGAHAVDVTLAGRSSSILFDVTKDADTTNDDQTGDVPTVGLLDLVGTRSVVLNQDTEATAEKIKLTVAASPLELEADQRANSETRLVFGGVNGTGAAASQGVRLNADEITVAVGDDSTGTSTLFAEDEGSPAAPTDLGLLRSARGDYRGLQLRSRSGALRPETVSIRQDGSLTVTQGAATGAGELDLAGAYGNAVIGADGQHLTLESSDGTLTIEDAAGFNDVGPQGAGDAGKSFVTLLGGLLLPTSPGGVNPDPETVTSPNSVVFRDGVATLGTDGTEAFTVESLTVSTPGDLTVTQQILDGIAAVAELVFEAGRDTGVDSTAGRGTLTIAAATTLEASRRLALEGGSSGFGDLVFAGAGTTLSADEIELRAGPTGTSRNSDAADLSRVVGLQARNVALRDAQGAVFGDASSSAIAFRYRQAAGIDAATELPTLAQFGLTTGFRAAGDVVYAVRSDRGVIDLDDEIVGTNEADRFRDAALSLIGFQSNTLAAIDVSDDTAFVGKQVELGAVGRFTMSSVLARVFNRTGTDAAESVTLRAGAGGTGNLDFEGSAGTKTTIKAPTVKLVAGDGPGGESGSTINTGNAAFDLAGPGAARTFAYQMDGTFRVTDLPKADQFVGGATGLPNVLAIRNDGGAITIDDFNAEELPLAVASGPARLVLEAETIELNQKDGGDLELTQRCTSAGCATKADTNLFLRLRTNLLSLLASVSSSTDTESGRVLMGRRAGDTQRLTGTDADFDGESLLVEAFDSESDSVTTGNLSSISEEPDDSGQYDLASGRGPTTITLRQDGDVRASDLAHRNSFSGLLTRSLVDDENDDPIATTYTIESLLGTTTVEPENVNGSRLVLGGVGATPSDGAIDFAPGSGLAPGVFVLSNLVALTADSIVIRAGTQLLSQNGIALTAAAVGLPKDRVDGAFGSIRFLGGHADGAVTRLEANTIALTAGPAVSLTNPDGDRDGERDAIAPENLPKLDLSGLDAVALAGDADTSSLRLRQNAAFDARRGQSGDFLTALEAGAAQAGPNGAEWSELEVVALQGPLRLAELDLIADEASHLTARTGADGTIVVDMPDQADSAAPFDDFAFGARFESNDITFQTRDPNTSLDLATDKLLIVSLALTGLESLDDFGRLRSDMATDDPDLNTVLRPIVRIHQAAAFTNTKLPRPSQYAVADVLGNAVRRARLEGLDIELKTLSTDPRVPTETWTPADLTLDDAIRARVTGSNLILRAAGDVVISLADRTPGFEELPAYADLQLTTLDVESSVRLQQVGSAVEEVNLGTGTIRIDPFTVAGNAADLTVETKGDQRFGNDVELRNTLVTTGRDVDFAGDVTQSGNPSAGLVVGSSGRVRFEGNLGTLTDRLARLWVLFKGDSGDGSDARTPTVEFGKRTDQDGDGIFETAVASDQAVFTQDDVLVVSSGLSTRKLMAALVDPDPNVPNDGIDDVVDLADLDILLRNPKLDLGRDRPANFATIGKALGDLLFDSANGFFAAGAGEKISVGGDLSIEVGNAVAAFSDVSALTLTIDANEIGLLRRDAGVTLDASGQTHPDGGPAIVANALDFGGLAPTVIGRGRTPRFGLPDPFAAAKTFPFLDAFPVFGLRPNGRALTVNDFRFDTTSGPLAERTPFLLPTGPSRSDLSGAYGPVRVPTSKTEISDPLRLADPQRLRALDVETRPASHEVVQARLRGGAIIDDRDRSSTPGHVVVTESRVDARDAEAAIGLYDRLFGQNDEHVDHLRGVLQQALDQYRETNHASRVVGFELRRFVKNRPSTLIEAYTTLEDLDALFRYHRRLGLSPGEFKRIQHGWLEKIRPTGIEVEELAETVHPSRYVRGSDILDIFGQ